MYTTTTTTKSETKVRNERFSKGPPLPAPPVTNALVLATDCLSHFSRSLWMEQNKLSCASVLKEKFLFSWKKQKIMFYMYRYTIEYLDKSILLRRRRRHSYPFTVYCVGSVSSFEGKQTRTRSYDRFPLG